MRETCDIGHSSMQRGALTLHPPPLNIYVQVLEGLLHCFLETAIFRFESYVHFPKLNSSSPSWLTYQRIKHHVYSHHIDRLYIQEYHITLLDYIQEYRLYIQETSPARQ